MAAGKNVISEKPVALSQEELEEMIAASKKYGKLFTVHQNRRWDPDFKCVQKILADNELGKVFRIESRVQGSRGIPGDWRNQKAHGGGMVLDWGIHLLDQALRIGEGRKLISVYAELTMSPTRNATTASESRLSSRATFRCMSRSPRAISSSFRAGMSSARTAPPL